MKQILKVLVVFFLSSLCFAEEEYVIEVKDALPVGYAPVGDITYGLCAYDDQPRPTPEQYWVSQKDHCENYLGWNYVQPCVELFGDISRNGSLCLNCKDVDRRSCQQDLCSDKHVEKAIKKRVAECEDVVNDNGDRIGGFDESECYEGDRYGEPFLVRKCHYPCYSGKAITAIINREKKDLGQVCIRKNSKGIETNGIYKSFTCEDYFEDDGQENFRIVADCRIPEEEEPEQEDDGGSEGECGDDDSSAKTGNQKFCISKASGAVVADPVAIYAGNLYDTRKDISLDNGLEIEIRPYYNSNKKHQGIIGYGWSSLLEVRLFQDENNNFVLRSRKGYLNTFDNTGKNISKIINGYPLEIDHDLKNPYSFNNSGEVYHFDSLGVLRQIADRQGNSWSFEYEGDGEAEGTAVMGVYGISDESKRKDISALMIADYQVNSIVDDANSTRFLTFSYDDDSGLLSSIVDHAGREVSYTYDSSGNLTKHIQLDGLVREYNYDNPEYIHQLTKHHSRGTTCPNDVCHSSIGPWVITTWHEDKRVKTQTYEGTKYTFSDVTESSGLFGPVNGASCAFDAREITVTTGRYDNETLLDNSSTTYSDTTFSCANGLSNTHPNVNFRNQRVKESVEVLNADGDNVMHQHNVLTYFDSSHRKFLFYGNGNIKREYFRDHLRRDSLETRQESDGKTYFTRTLYKGDSELVERRVEGLLHNTLGDSTVTVYTYDAKGNRLTESVWGEANSDATKYTRSWTYSADGKQLKTETDFSGNTMTYIYLDAISKNKPYQKELASIDGDNVAETYTYKYTSRDLLEKETLPNGLIRTFTYNSNEKMLTRCEDDGLIVICDEDVYEGKYLKRRYRGRQYATGSSVLVTEGLITSYSYDQYGRKHKEWQVKSATDSTLLAEYHRDSNGNILWVKDELRKATNYKSQTTFDAFNRKTFSLDAMGNKTQFFYDVYDNLELRVDGEGNKTSYFSDSRGNSIQEKDAEGRYTSYLYDYNSQVTRKSPPLGANHWVHYEYDKLGNRILQRNELGYTTIWKYKGTQMIREISPLGQVITYEYNGQGSISKILRKKLDTTAINYTDAEATGDFVEKYFYDKEGNRTKIERGVSGSLITVRKMKYDKFNRLIADTNAVGVWTETEYHPWGGVKKILSKAKDDSNVENTLSRVEMKYNEFGSLTLRTVDGIKVDSLIYDDINRPIVRRTFGSGDDSTKYDLADFVTRRSDSSGVYTAFTADANNSVAKETRANDNGVGTKSKTYTLDGLNRVSKVTDERGFDIKTTYTLEGRVKTIEDNEGNATSYFYNYSTGTGQRRDSTRFANNAMELSVFDSEGKLIQKKDSRGTNITYTYNEFNLVDTIYNSGVRYKLFEYDSQLRLKTAIKVKGTDTLKMSMTYDNASRPLSVVTRNLGVNRTISYSYDNVNRMVTITYPSGKVSQKVFDSRNRLESVTFDGSTVLDLAYDKSQLSSKTLGNGIVGSYSYDEAGRVTGISYDKSSVQMYGLDFGLNANGNVGWVDRPDLTDADETMSYYADGQIQNHKLGTGVSGSSGYSLTASSTNSWTYDSRGNWSTYNAETRSHSNTNQLSYITKGASVGNPTYDALGNLRGYSLDGNSKYLIWDSEGMLKTITEGTKRIEYYYDALNRRVARKVFLNNVEQSKTEYIFSNWKVIEERTGSEIKSFVTSSYIDELSFYDVNGTKYYPLQGSNVNIEAVTDASGAIVERYEISAFGNVKILAPDGTERASTAVGNNHYFQGRYADSESEYVYFRNRWFSPEFGRFISRDPIRFKAGDINLYRFVGNNPLNTLDPLGLEAWKIDGKSYITTDNLFGEGHNWFAATVLLGFGLEFDDPEADGLGAIDNHRLGTTSNIDVTCKCGKVESATINGTSGSAREILGVADVIKDITSAIGPTIDMNSELDAPIFKISGVGKSQANFLAYVSGRPPIAADRIGLSFRKNRTIYHIVTGSVRCDGDKALLNTSNVAISGSKFPTHSLYVDGTHKQTIPQGSIDELFKLDK